MMAKTKDMFDHYSQFRVHTMLWNLLYIASKFHNFFKKNRISYHSCVLFNSINQMYARNIKLGTIGELLTLCVGEKIVTFIDKIYMQRQRN